MEEIQEVKDEYTLEHREEFYQSEAGRREVSEAWIRKATKWFLAEVTRLLE